MSGAGKACPVGRLPGTGGAAPPPPKWAYKKSFISFTIFQKILNIKSLRPGRLGIAGAGRFPAGGGGPRLVGPPIDPSEPWEVEKLDCCGSTKTKEKKFTCWTGAFFLLPPGLGGESLGFSPVGSQSFLTGAGIGVEKVAIVTSPKRILIKISKN